MKKATSKPTGLLALALALLALLGMAPVSAVAAKDKAFIEAPSYRATPGNSNDRKRELVILQEPDDLDFIVGVEYPSLIGLIVSLDGREFSYNTDLDVSFDLDYYPQRVGENEYTLEVWYTIDRVQGSIWGTAALTYTGISALDSIAMEPIPLTLFERALTDLSQVDGEFTLFSFVPDKTGNYYFGRWWEDDDDVYVYGFLLDAEGNRMDYPWYNDQELQAGETYYLVVDYRYYSETAPLVTVEICVYKGYSPPRTLALNKAETVSYEDCYFRFTPEEEGWYTFKSFGSEGTDPVVWVSDWYDDWYWSNDDAQLVLYDESSYYCRQIGSVYKSTLDFSLSMYMYEGQEYYIECRNWNEGGGGEYQVIATKTQDRTAQLDLQNVTLNVRERKSIESLFKTIPDCDILFLEVKGGAASIDGAITGMRRGESEVIFRSIAGEKLGTAKITVKYSLIQWLQVIFLGGWLWLPVR